LVALLLSTQFLAQPFVWQYFEYDEIFSGWILILGDRLFVALVIAVVLSLTAMRRSWRSNLLALFLSLAAGATLAELLLLVIDPQSDRDGAGPVTGRILRWIIVVGGLYLIFRLWQRREEAAALSQAAELRKQRAEGMLKKLKIEALQRQIEPHFLFNTLATIRRMQRASPAEGRLLLSRLMEFLQASYASHETVGTLHDELTLVSAYLDVCAIRMDGLLTWSFDVPAGYLDLEFPRFALATLVENSIKHGIANDVGGGSIRIAARPSKNALEVRVEDTGSGFSAEMGSGIGLANIISQLRLRYGDKAWLDLAANEPRGVVATISLPIEQAA
jgi:signal transduction histidine kinase